jgi:hypothetical protein
MKYLVIVRFILLIIATLGLASCSVGMALYGKEDVDYHSLKDGLDREVVISKLGQPQTTTTSGSGVMDTYLIEHGSAPSFGRAAKNAFFSIGTLGILEPFIMASEYEHGEEAIMTIQYDLNNKLKSFPILKNKSIVLTICSQPEGAYITNGDNEQLGIACHSSKVSPQADRDNCLNIPKGLIATWASGATVKSPEPLIICKENTTITWEDIKSDSIHLQYDFKRPTDANNIGKDLDVALKIKHQKELRDDLERKARLDFFMMREIAREPIRMPRGRFSIPRF